MKMYKAAVAGAVGVVLVGLVGGYVLARPESKVVRIEAYEVATASTEQLTTMAGQRVFFGHQSVGGNILDAIPAVFADAGVDAPDIVESADAAMLTGPMILHSFVGRNGDPLGKLAEFDRIIRGGMGDVIDVAVFKLCYIDLHDGDDVPALFEAYRDTIAALERDYPDVTFISTTMPLTTEFGGPIERMKRRIKAIIGRDNPFVPAHNIAREELNALIRAEWGATGRLFDIAAVQSTDVDGRRHVRRSGGSEYVAMEDFIASDPGHLNATGATIVASALVSTIADTAA